MRGLRSRIGLVESQKSLLGSRGLLKKSQMNFFKFAPKISFSEILISNIGFILLPPSKTSFFFPFPFSSIENQKTDGYENISGKPIYKPLKIIKEKKTALTIAISIN